MFGSVEEGLDKDGVPTMRVMSAVDVKQTHVHELTLEWDSSASNDMIADSALALITGIDKSPASVKLTTSPHSHKHDSSHPHADSNNEASSVMRIQRLAMFLEAHFGEVELHMPDVPDEPEQGEDDHEPSLIVRLDEADAQINLLSLTVSSSNEALKKRVEAVLDMAVTTVSSLTESFMSGVPVPNEDIGLTKDDFDPMDITLGESAKAIQPAKLGIATHAGNESDESESDVLEVHG